MAQAQEGKDQSMEDILQSIKRIIADEEKAPADQSTQAPAVKALGSEVLELHDLVEQPKEDVQSKDAEIAPVDHNPLDVLHMIDHMPPVAAPVVAVEEVVVEATPSKDAATEALLSDAVVQDATAALQMLKVRAQTPPPPPPPPPPVIAEVKPKLDVTIEDLVREALRPELRAWLNTHMTGIVERMVAEEIKKIHPAS
ncbi:MAG: DUF2497 domain-containing protein [Alphaproteobacteria bacterium]|nr:MAG: DUF2497 domain-containing protein [Alphaproteobacteria bacterium]TAF15170.1 MAG: DUF2497 domain-containing protein [Alphaproteobacteria bacterium]TAF41513.1 MAG: DUF2497 domain-containing protein [Alphaproteobacteria bacterium]TAF77037.1 MAG: DUF2497 domain-containing protein [Alphaproteobacteria bacterium]